MVPSAARPPKLESIVSILPSDDLGDVVGEHENELTEGILCKGKTFVCGSPRPLSYEVDDIGGLDLHRVTFAFRLIRDAV